ncbi:MAG TPA: LysR family transcriptional regulator, partial [Stellaceae bacterium]|nr:LysR family transcriptional regulator [Stellaceae bacterium]
MDTGDLAVFAAVAQAGGITRAAQRLNRVQSNVTQRVRLLEAELGVPLFQRHSRGVSLTSAGRQLLPYAERIGALMAEAKQAASDSGVPRGQIVIGALETATAMRLPPVLAAYAAACPDVDIEIVTGTSAALIEAVRERHIEAAFVAGPVDHAQLTALPLLEEELVVVSAPGLTRARRHCRRGAAQDRRVPSRLHLSPAARGAARCARRGRSAPARIRHARRHHRLRRRRHRRHLAA